MRSFDIGSGKIVEMADVAYYFSIKGSSYGETNSIVNTRANITRAQPYAISGGYEIVQEGEDNKLGYQLMQLLEDNNLGLGVLRRQRGLQYGQGLALYEVKYDAGGRRNVVWKWDDNIGKWLEGFDYEEYLINVLFDLLCKNEFYTKLIRNRGTRVGGSSQIVSLEHVPAADCRRQWPDARGRIANIFTGDWSEGEPDTISRYPVYDPIMPITKEAYMYWSSFYMYGRGAQREVVPGYWGARKWMQRSNVAPDILKAQTDNGLNIKWHIVSPQAYWDTKREILMKQCEQKKQEYKESMLEELKDNVLQGLSKVLSGIENVGKFFHSEAVMQELGIGKKEVIKWEIIPIDMKVKEFTDAQIEISNKADQAITSAMGLHPSLSNILIDKKLASGSELLYAYKLFIATDTKIYEKKSLEVLNMLKKVMFPNVPGKFGFYHDIVKREEDITSSERTVNLNE
jgi:hypothetical protein